MFCTLQKTYTIYKKLKLACSPAAHDVWWAEKP